MSMEKKDKRVPWYEVFLEAVVAIPVLFLAGIWALIAYGVILIIVLAVTSIVWAPVLALCTAFLKWVGVI